MTQHSEHSPYLPAGSPGPSEDLPADFEADLRRLDDLVGEHAAQASVPRPLSARVFDASVSGLPQPSLPQPKVGWTGRLVGAARPASPLIWRRLGWSQLAMAASLGLAFVVAAVVMRSPAERAERMAVIGPEIEIIRVADLGRDPRSIVDQQVAYLIDTAALSSFDEISGELESIVADLEM